MSEQLNKEQIREQVKSLQASLKQAREGLVKQDGKLKQLAAPPFMYATVVAVNRPPQPKPRYQWREYYDSLYGRYRRHKVLIKPKIKKGTGSKPSTATIALEGNRLFEVFLPEESKEEINAGTGVMVNSQTMQIIKIASVQIGGDIGSIRRVIDEDFVEVDHQSVSRVIFAGQFGKTLEKGDRVVLDSTATVVVRNLGKDGQRFKVTVKDKITWKDIGGLEEAKEQMIEAVELPQRHPELFKFYGKKPINGILLYGPPGCGKTMLGKATATAIADAHNGKSNNQQVSGFLYVKGPEILDRFVGVAEATIRQIFQWARKHKETQGYPAVVFIDEAEAILPKRGSGISSDIERTIVPMFLSEMSGLEDSGAIVILATNRPDILDPAVVREGRMDRKIKVDRPDIKSSAEIFLLHLKQIPLNNGFSRQQLAELGAKEVFSPRYMLYQIQTKDGKNTKFTLANLVHGGMIAGIVDQATSIALKRDLEKRRKTGICKEDLLAAVGIVFRQNRDLNHTDELEEFVHDFRDDVVGIHRLRQGSN